MSEPTKPKPSWDNYERAEELIGFANDSPKHNERLRTIALALDEAEKRGAERERRQSPEKSPRHFIDKQTGE